MLSRLIEMVSIILARSLETEEDEWVLLRPELTEQLQSQGFNGQEIDIAFEVANKIRSRIDEGSSIAFPLKTNKIYQFLEELKLTKAARGYLLTLMNVGTITPEQREEVVERAFFLDVNEVGVHEVEFLINQVFGGENWPGEDSPSMSYALH